MAHPVDLLIIDDSRAYRATCLGFLGDRIAAAVRACGTGAEGLRLIRERRPDCAVVAFELPDMTGIDVLDALDAEFGAYAPAVVVMSEGRSVDVAVSALKRGAHDYLDKGRLTAEELCRAIGEAIEKQRRRQELKTTEQRYRTLSTVLPVGLFQADATGRNLSVNDTWIELTGLTDADAAGSGWLTALHPEDRARIEAAWQRTVAMRCTFDEEYRYLRPDGSHRWVLGRAAPTISRAGVLTGFVGTVTDINARKHDEEQQRESSALLRLALEATSSAFSWDLQTNVVRQIHSSAAVPLLSGQTHVFEDALALVYHEDRALFAANARAAIASPDGRYSSEFRVIGEDGEVHWLGESGQVERDAQGRPVRLVGLSIDITARKRADEAIRESEERLRLALDAARLGVWTWDIPTNRVFWSSEVHEILHVREFGGTIDDFTRLVHPEDVQGVWAAVTRAIEQHTRYTVEFRTLSPDGRVRWMANHGRASHDRTGRPLRVLGVVYDITERKRAEQERAQLLESERRAREEAESASRAKDEFLAVISHELRTPLNAIVGWGQLLRVKRSEGLDVNRAVDTIVRNAKAQTQLIDDLLDLSRIISGKMRVEVAPFDLRQVIMASVDVLQPAAKLKQIALVVDVPLDLPEVHGDAERFQQIMWNLVSNAVKFTPERGRVAIGVALAGDGLRVEVSDTGAGIQTELLPFVFDRFRQGDASITRRHSGLGLGLSIARHLVELHGGQISARSQGLNAGSTFVVTLPFRPPEAGSTQASRAREEAPELLAARIEGIRILVVDDRPDSRELLELVLTGVGAEVVAAPSGAVALAVVGEEGSHFDALVCDIGMPEMDGYAVIQELRRRNDWRHLPAVAVTAFASPLDKRRALEAGFDAHLSKPVQTMELLATLARLLRTRPPYAPRGAAGP